MRTLQHSIPRVVCAPMAGGPSTVELAAAVCDAGGLGFLAAGYLRADVVEQQIGQLASTTEYPFGVNLFVVAQTQIDQHDLDAYLESLSADAEELETRIGEAKFDDDDFDAKLALLLRSPVPVVSFTFGCPSRAIVQSLQGVGSKVWVTVASVEDAALAQSAGCDAFVAQGIEAGGHRGSFDDDGGADGLTTVRLVRELHDRTEVPVIAAGGIATAEDVSAALAAGATSVQAGTAFLLTPEAGTNALHRSAIGSQQPTALTRAFTGRTARGIVNGFMRSHPDAPSAYPQIHFATAPIRAAARIAGRSDYVNLWAGTRHALTRAVPARDVVRALDVSAR